MFGPDTPVIRRADQGFGRRVTAFPGSNPKAEQARSPLDELGNTKCDKHMYVLVQRMCPHNMED